MSIRKLFQRNQKKILAVFGALLMVVFIIQLAPQGQQSVPTARTIATLDGAKITQLDINIAAEEWQELKRLRFVDPNHPEANSKPLVIQILGADLANRINQTQNSNQSSPLFFLLVEEARRQGIVISKEDLQTYLTSFVEPLPEAGTDDRERVEQAVGDCLMIDRMLRRASSVIKITRPYQQLALARTAQDLSLKFVPILASSFLSQVPTPTDNDLRNQFDQFSDQIAGQFGQKSDPLGFGYKIPNRVQVQFIGLNHADLRDAAVASKSKEDWYVAAYGEFKSNRDDYDSRPLPSDSQPDKQLGPSTHPSASTQGEPAPRKIENLDDDFALHAPLVLDDLYDQETQKLQDTILRQINEKMSSGYGSYRDALASGAAAAAAGPAAQYVSYKFIEDLAASIRSQYGIRPILGNIQQVRSGQQLAQIEGIGRSMCPIAGSNQAVPFPIYATQLFQPWVSDEQKSSQFAALAIALWQPSNPLVEETQRNIYIFRISGSDPAHTPAFADVKEQVTNDWKINAAYEKAVEAAHALLSSAQHHGLDAAAAKLSSPIVTDLFNPESILAGRVAPSIPPLNLTPDSARELANIAQQLLTTPVGGNNRPQLLAELYADRIVSVIELREAKPAWDSQDKALLTMSIMANLEQSQRIPLISQLCTVEAVSDRLNYHVEAAPTTAGSP